MSKRMLIDAGHPEETRVVIVDGTKVEELDFESAAKKQLRGNLYLARVTRVEPSLQAAFVEYGGNRHGFLAFSEIHPDYYQIPFEDRMALLEAEEAETLEEAAEEEAEDEAKEKKKSKKGSKSEKSKKTPEISTEAEGEADETTAENSEVDDTDSEEIEIEGVDADTTDGEKSDVEDITAGDDEVDDEQEKTAKKRKSRSYRQRYKIQEVIKRGQILLIQVVKEERGNKGAAMTTYLSLAGRYCVLMPNTPKGGGISRKIANGSDRKRLKSIVSEFKVPQGMGVIVRTAGAKRTKTEIKRDYDYLCRLWETIRTTTLESMAPALIHEEGNLVKRSIRDLYNKDIKEVLVQGDEAYKTAKDFIKMLMPSHSKYVKAYKDDIPLFLRYQVESQIEDSLDSVVQLKSGGYLVIHPTEALVSIDVNSGRSTKERNVERTALKTNLEAAVEVARQMRLRDLAGLVVIDFIDMDEYRNNRAVEKKMKEALAKDRARVQAGRISQFGLMEISRQRRRRSLLEGSSISCPHCEGVGRKRTIESSALKALRAIEETAARGQTAKARLTTAPEVAAFILNDKREELNRIQEKFDMYVVVEADPELYAPNFVITEEAKAKGKNKDPLAEIEKELKKAKEDEAKKSKSKSKKSKSKSDEDEAEDEDNDEEEAKSKSRRRRGRRGGRKRKSSQTTAGADVDVDISEDSKGSSETSKDSEEKSEEAPKKTRSRRSRTRSKNKTDEKTESDLDTESDDAANASNAKDEDKDEKETKKPARRTRSRKSIKKDNNKDETVKDDISVEAPVETVEEAKPDRKPSRSTTRRKAPSRKSEAEATDTHSTEDAEKKKTSRRRKASSTKTETAKKETKKASTSKKTSAKSGDDPQEGSKKRGWWQRRS